MKKIALLLIISMIFAVLSACSGSESSDTSNASGITNNASDDPDSASGTNGDSNNGSSDHIDPNDGKYADAGELKLRIFKMGKSDAYLFRTSEKTILIDCGDVDDAEEIITYFQEKGISKIDYLIFTHLDKKSIGGAAALIKAISVGTIYEPDYQKSSEAYTSYESAIEEKAITATKISSVITFAENDVSFKITPCEKSYYSDEDNYAVTISVSHGDNSFLFVGDAKSERINEIINSTSQHDFLMMPDNGAWDAKTSALLDAIAPSYAVITCSDKNPASTDVLSLLSSKSINYYLTSNGSVKITSDGNQLTVEQ